MKLAALGFVMLLLSVASATPRDDLASPSQQVRDAAAEKVRATYKPTPRSRFKRLVKAIQRRGMTKRKVLALLKPYNPTMEGGGASGGGETILFRIDDGWI